MEETVKTFSIKVIKQLKNTWINVKRSELMEVLVLMMTSVLRTISGCPQRSFGGIYTNDYSHLFIVYLDRHTHATVSNTHRLTRSS